MGANRQKGCAWEKKFPDALYVRGEKKKFNVIIIYHVDSLIEATIWLMTSRWTFVYKHTLPLALIESVAR